MQYFAWTIQILLLPAISPLFIGVIRKLKAKLQKRRGASIFQPYKDIWKLLNKDEIVSSDASWVFKFAPFIVFGITLVVSFGIPTISSFTSNHMTSDIIAIIYLLAIGTFFLALAGMDVGGPFGGFGSSREMTVSALTEGGLLLSMATLALMSKTTNLFDISSFISENHQSFILPIAISFIGFFIALLAETARFPFDNPSTHLELTMIHEAMLLEYSGKRLALMEWASANKLAIFISIGASLFFPFGIAESSSLTGIIIGLAVFLIKALIFCSAIAFIESSMAKLRLFRLPDLLFTSFILGIIAIGLLI